jgi:hypothetical protein
MGNGEGRRRVIKVVVPREGSQIRGFRSEYLFRCPVIYVIYTTSIPAAFVFSIDGCDLR